MVAAGYGAADRLLRTGDTSTGTLVLAGTPHPLNVPGATAGQILASDSSGNFTAQAAVSGAPTGSASGDLSGSYPGPTVAGITGVAVTNSATAGNTLVVQSGGTTAHWQAPAGGSPSGSASGDLSGTYPGPVVAGVDGIPITNSAAAGNTLVVQSGGTALHWSTPAAGVTLDTIDNPSALGTASPGVSGQASPADHAHPSTSIINGVTVGGSPASGKVPLCTSSSAATWTAMLDSTNGDTKALASSASAGSGTISQAAQADHVHPTAGLALLTGAAFTGNLSASGTFSVAGNATASGTLAVSKAVTGGVSGLTDSGTITVNASLGNTFRVTINGNRTLGTPTGMTDGQMIIFEITQGSGAPYTLGFTGAYVAGATVPFPGSLSASAGLIDVLGFKYYAANNVWRLLAVALGFSS